MKTRNRKYNRKSRKIKGGMMNWTIVPKQSVSRQSSDEIAKLYNKVPSPGLSRQSSDEIAMLYSQVSRQPSPGLYRQPSDIARLYSLDSDDIELNSQVSRQSSPGLSKPSDIARLYSLDSDDDIEELYQMSKTSDIARLFRKPSIELTVPEVSDIYRQTSDEIDDIVRQFKVPTNAFTDLCNRHIGQNLDEVIETIWLQNGQSNIFLIGENHKPHTKCIGILDMFKHLVEDVKRNNMDVDLLIEHTQYDTLPEVIQQHKVLTSESYQINYIRDYFNTCILNRNCDIRVHWTDPSMSNKIEEWLHLLSFEELGSIRWVNTSIYESFNSEAEIPRLVTDNTILTKEIRKASRYVPQFTLEWVVDLFMTQYRQNSIIYPDYSWKKLVTIQLRHVMDFYTVARILSFQMKNVIVYGGFAHMTYIKHLLNQLDYMTVDTVDGKCFT